MWILHICHSYYPPFLDCARQYCVLFKDTPYKVLTVYLTGDPSEDVALQTDSDEVIFLGYKSKQVKGLKLNAIANIRKIVKNRDFSFCIAHRVKPTYVGLLATQLPVISVHHNYDDYKRWSRRILVNFYKNRMLMLGVSNDVRDDLRQDLKSWDACRIQTLYNHLDVDRTQSNMVSVAMAKQTLGLPENSYVIANVGRLHHDKDQATLIKAYHQALSQLPTNCLLYIAGKGPLEQSLKALVHELGLDSHVIFSGHVPDLKRYFKAFNLFVLSSDREPFGMVLLEAMAANLPIICSNCGGAAEVVKNIGRLFPFANTEKLSRELLRYANQYPAKEGGYSAVQVLNNQFSDAAVKRAFWQLDFVKKVVS